MGEDEVELALMNVRQHFCFIGRQDRADADVLTLQRLVGLPTDPLLMDNVTAAIDSEEFDALDWNKIAERNRADMLLYTLLEREGLLSRALA